MSDPTHPVVQAPANPKNQASADDRLIKNFRISQKMRPFAHRMRLRLNDLDLTDPATANQFESACDEMRKILLKKKISEAKANRAIARTLEAAADHQLDRSRRDVARKRSGDVTKLVARLEQLAIAVSKLSPQSKGVLNKVVAKHTKDFFDTETFSALVYAVGDALPKLSPRRWADEAGTVICDEVKVAGIVRTAPLELVTLWESMPSTTRIQVEQEVRRSPPCRSIAEFLRDLIALLEKFYPVSEAGRQRAIEYLFAQRAGRIWESLGLRIGRAFDGFYEGRSIDSSFQRFCNAALAAVGDRAKISGRQIVNLKRIVNGKEQH